MPKKDGREALREIKMDPELCHIPVIVFTTSQATEDIEYSYDNGVNSFIAKPASYSELVDTMTGIKNYWTKIVRLTSNKP